MRILVAQTTRMGDVLQTSPLIQELRNKYPDAHIAVQVRRMGKTIAERHPAVDEIIVYNEDDMFLHLRARDSNRLLEAYETADAQIRKLREGNFDVAYNVTHSIASAMLMKMAGIPNVVGADLSDEWQFVLRGRWTTYFFTSVHSRDYNDLNLCDITRNFVRDAPPCRRLVFALNDEDRAFVDDLFARHKIGPDDFVACFQLGASEENKRWPETRFAELARRLVEKHGARIFLVGVAEEAPLGERFAETAPGLAVPLYGKTTIPQLAALLERSRVLVSNDTGTMHIAASVGCPIALVSVGHVHYRETGPYGEGHCAIEWRRERLGRSDFVPGAAETRDRITARQAELAVEVVLRDDPARPVRQLTEDETLRPVDLYVTRFAPDGALQFYPVVRRPMAERDFVRIAYRAMWLDYLDNHLDKKVETESLARMLRHFEGLEVDDLDVWRKALHKAFDGLASMAQRGVQRTEKLIEALRKGKGAAQAKQLVAELMAIDEEARVHGELNPPCKPLVLMARFERDNLEGADPMVLAKTTLEIYRACFTRARLMTRKIDRIAALWEG